jgi:transposase
VDAFTEQTEAISSVDPAGSVRVYMVLELKEMRDGAMVPESKKSYSDRQIHRVLNRRPNVSQPNDNLDSVVFLPYVGPIYNRISRVLFRHKVKSVGLSPKKVSSFLRPVKENLGLRTPGVYRIPCECGKVFIRQTGRSVDAILKEHRRHIRL